MEESDLKTFQDIIELIPKILKISKKCVDEDLEIFDHDFPRIKAEINTLRNIIKIIQGKWIIDIMYCVRIIGEAHYNELKRLLTGISSRVLTDKLKILVSSKILERKIYETHPVGVSYTLTKFGENMYHLMVPILMYSLYFRKIDDKM